MNIVDDIINGLEKLHILRLRGAPSAESLFVVAKVWHEAIVAHCDWNEARDSGRIERAFTQLYAEVDYWPSPKQLIERLPPRKALPELAKPRPSEQEVQARHDFLNGLLDDIEQKFKGENIQ